MDEDSKPLRRGWPKDPVPMGMSGEVQGAIHFLKTHYPEAQVEVLTDDEGFCWQIDLPGDYRVILRDGSIFLMRGPLVADPELEDDLPIPGRLKRLESVQELQLQLPERSSGA